MKKINNNGLGKVEIISILTLIIVLFAVGLGLVSDVGKKYSYFKSVCNTFANNAAMYRNNYPIKDNKYYLDMLISKGYSEKIENPLNTTEECSEEESYVQIDDTSKNVYLVCGKYVVEGYQNQSYRIYKVTNWSEKEEKIDNDVETLYNYKKNDKLVLDEYVPLHTFIKTYNEIELVPITSISDFESIEGQELVEKNVYREKTLVKEIK